MLKIIAFVFILMPAMALGSSVTEDSIVGEWEWLGGSLTQSPNLKGLMSAGPNIAKFHADGKYEYISTDNGKQSKPVIGNWVFQNNILSITRPDNGTINYKFISFQSGVLETQDDYIEAYRYMKKK